MLSLRSIDAKYEVHERNYKSAQSSGGNVAKSLLKMKKKIALYVLVRDTCTRERVEVKVYFISSNEDIWTSLINNKKCIGSLLSYPNQLEAQWVLNSSKNKKNCMWEQKSTLPPHVLHEKDQMHHLYKLCEHLVLAPATTIIKTSSGAKCQSVAKRRKWIK